MYIELMIGCPLSDCTAGALFGSFGSATGPIHLDNVNCDGMEESLFDCMSENNLEENVFCYASESAGVICTVEGDIGKVQ